MAFSTRYIDEYEAEVRLDLRDSATTWSNGELNRSMQRAVDDMSRSYPLEAVYEHTIIQTVTNEASTAPVVGTYVALGYKPIKQGSEKVKNTATTTYVRDTDYTIDYANGEYTIIAAGSITAADSLLVSYSKDTLGIDISTILTNLIRVVGVEYPVGEIPQKKVAFSIWNDFMFIGSQVAGESQKELSDKEHIAIYYEKTHTASLVSTAPSYPAFMDEVICIGTGGYALMIKAIELEHQAVTDLASVRTELGYIGGVDGVSAVHALADAALDKVALYLETNDTTDNAKDVLANITDEIAGLRTAVDNAVDAANTYLDEVDTTDLGQATVGAEGLLETGDSLINTVNVGGENVPVLYADYSRARATIAQVRTQAALGYLQEATTRLQNLQTYISEAGAWMRMGDTFISEAQARISEMDRYLAEAMQYQEATGNDIILSDRYRAEGQIRLAEFHSILSSRSEYRKRTASIPVRQPA